MLLPHSTQTSVIKPPPFPLFSLYPSLSYSHSSLFFPITWLFNSFPFLIRLHNMRAKSSHFWFYKISVAWLFIIYSWVIFSYLYKWMWCISILELYCSILKFNSFTVLAVDIFIINAQNFCFLNYNLCQKSLEHSHNKALSMTMLRFRSTTKDNHPLPLKTMLS